MVRFFGKCRNSISCFAACLDSNACAVESSVPFNDKFLIISGSGSGEVNRLTVYLNDWIGFAEVVRKVNVFDSNWIIRFHSHILILICFAAFNTADCSVSFRHYKHSVCHYVVHFRKKSGLNPNILCALVSVISDYVIIISP